MAQDWRFYFCVMEGLTASVFVDLEALDYIEGCPDRLFKLHLTYKYPKTNGLPIQEEFENVDRLEHVLENLSHLGTDYYVGRITVEGKRHYYVYSDRELVEWELIAEELQERSGYEIQVIEAFDPKHLGYLEDLYPSEVDWRSICDLEKIEKLERLGNDSTASREIYHVSYFLHKGSADQFLLWALDQGYQQEASISWKEKEHAFMVKVSHHGSLGLKELSEHSVAMMQEAKHFGGNYEGWFTTIVGSKPNES